MQPARNVHCIFGMGKTRAMRNVGGKSRACVCLTVPAKLRREMPVSSVISFRSLSDELSGASETKRQSFNESLSGDCYLVAYEWNEFCDCVICRKGGDVDAMARK